MHLVGIVRAKLARSRQIIRGSLARFFAWIRGRTVVTQTHSHPWSPPHHVYSAALDVLPQLAGIWWQHVEDAGFHHYAEPRRPEWLWRLIGRERRRIDFRSDPYMCVTKLTLIIAELIELVEALRRPDWETAPDKHLKDTPHYQVEFADVLIRFLDLTEALGITRDVVSVAIRKSEYNHGPRREEREKRTRWGKRF